MKNKEKSTGYSKYIAIVKENEDYSSGTQNELVFELESKDLQSAMNELKKIIIGEFEEHEGAHLPDVDFYNGIKSIFIYEINFRVEIPFKIWEFEARKIEREFREKELAANRDNKIAMLRAELEKELELKAKYENN